MFFVEGNKVYDENLKRYGIFMFYCSGDEDWAVVEFETDNGRGELLETRVDFLRSVVE